jgi:hypothetical protein
VVVSPDAEIFPPDALDANREGRLTDAQRDKYRRMSRSIRKGELGLAPFPIFIGAIVLVVDFSGSPQLSRTLVGVGLLAIGLFLLWRALAGGDPLTRDLRNPKVEVVEGAITKRSVATASRRRGRSHLYYLDVEKKSFQITSTAYDAAPPAGFVRLYYLQHSHKVVNLELLPNRPLPEGTTTQDVLQEVGAAMRSHDATARPTAYGDLSTLATTAMQHMTTNTAPPRDSQDPSPLEEAIVGTWSGPLMTVSFAPDGTVTARLPVGPERHGRWSVDRRGRLESDIRGRMGSADAWVVGDQLTISMDGEALAFTRSPGG